MDSVSLEASVSTVLGSSYCKLPLVAVEIRDRFVLLVFQYSENFSEMP